MTWTLVVDVKLELVEPKVELLKLESEPVVLGLTDWVELVVVNADGGIRSKSTVEITVTVPSPKLVT